MIRIDLQFTDGLFKKFDGCVVHNCSDKVVTAVTRWAPTKIEVHRISPGMFSKCEALQMDPSYSYVEIYEGEYIVDESYILVKRNDRETVLDETNL